MSEHLQGIYLILYCLFVFLILVRKPLLLINNCALGQMVKSCTYTKLFFVYYFQRHVLECFQVCCQANLAKETMAEYFPMCIIAGINISVDQAIFQRGKNWYIAKGGNTARRGNVGIVGVVECGVRYCRERRYATCTWSGFMSHFVDHSIFRRKHLKLANGEYATSLDRRVAKQREGDSSEEEVD